MDANFGIRAGNVCGLKYIVHLPTTWKRAVVFCCPSGGKQISMSGPLGSGHGVSREKSRFQVGYIARSFKKGGGGYGKRPRWSPHWRGPAPPSRFPFHGFFHMKPPWQRGKPKALPRRCKQVSWVLFRLDCPVSPKKKTAGKEAPKGLFSAGLGRRTSDAGSFSGMCESAVALWAQAASRVGFIRKAMSRKRLRRLGCPSR